MRRPLSVALAGAAASLLLLGSSCTSDAEPVQQVDAAEAVELIEAGEHTVIDVRTPAEFASGHVQGAENVDVTAPTFEKQIERLDKDVGYVVYCQSGNRSAVAAEKMADHGFSEVVDGGGITGLEAGGAPMTAGG